MRVQNAAEATGTFLKIVCVDIFIQLKLSSLPCPEITVTSQKR
jgi:hypothetical protein